MRYMRALHQLRCYYTRLTLCAPSLPGRVAVLVDEVRRCRARHSMACNGKVKEGSKRSEYEIYMHEFLKSIPPRY